MKRLILALLLFCTLALSTQGFAGRVRVCGKVVEIIDGDTFIILVGKNRVEVTLQHIDSPEEGQPCNEIAKRHLSDLILGKDVCFYLNEVDEDENVLLGDAYMGEMNVGLQMVRDGVAWHNDVDDGLLDELDLRLLTESEQAARSEHRGIWQDPAPVAPWDYRRLNAAKYGLDTSIAGGGGGNYGVGGYQLSGWKTVYVRDYYRRDGTHVNSYWRSAPGMRMGGRSSGLTGHSSAGRGGGGRGGGRH